MSWKILTLLIFTSLLLKGQELKVYGKRGKFFVVNKNGLPKEGRVFSGSKKRGRFRVVMEAGGESLCMLLSGDMNFDGISTNIAPEDKVKPETSDIVVRNITCRPLGVDKWLSIEPVPLSKLKPPGISGLRCFLGNSERYFLDVAPLGFLLEKGYLSSKGKIILSKIDGELCVLPEDRNGPEYIPVSGKTLKVFKDKIFFYLLVKNKRE